MEKWMPRRDVSSFKTSSSDGSNQNNKNLGRVEDLTVALYTALVKTGAADIVGRRKSSVVVMSQDLNRRLAGAAIAEQETSTGVGKTTTTTNDTSVTRPRRRLFRLNICPAPDNTHIRIERERKKKGFYLGPKIAPTR
jgi:hypothetical protein